MALFNKTKFDDVTLESTKYQNQQQPAAKPAATNSRTPSTPVNTSSARPSAPPSGYGIQEAIELIRKLPNVNTDIVITVVIKTLESANISVDKIIKDAQSREHKIEDRSGRLIAKIDALEAEIAELNEEITQLNTDLEETNRVRELLLRSLNIEPEKAAPKPNMAAGESATNTSQPTAEASKTPNSAATAE